MNFTLKNHPFAVEAFFNASLVLTYAAPAHELQHLIPECLQLDTFNNTWAFVAAAFVDTTRLRPKGFPGLLGNDFFLIGFRVFVRYQTNAGKRLRGLYILKSETNSRQMSFFGNIFTHYNYTSTDIRYKKDQGNVSIFSAGSELDVEVSIIPANPPLPASSPFADWKEARRFAGPLPFTFTFNKKTKEILIIEGVREHWDPAPVTVIRNKIGFIDGLKMPGIVLANAFLIEKIPYYWKKGKMEIWKG